MTSLQQLRFAILVTQLNTVAPIESIRVTNSKVDPPVIQIIYQLTATQQQRVAAQSIVDNFNWTLAGQQAYLESLSPEKKNLLQAAVNAIQNNNTFINLASPTNAQVLAQTKALSQQINQIIRRFVEIA